MIKIVWRITMIAIAILINSAAMAQANIAQDNSGKTQDNKVEAAVALIRLLDRPGQINLVTIWDGNKYIQCRTMNDRSMRCEAAGTSMQPSLEHILTPDRIGRLIARGWMLDPSFGNYARSFAPATSAKVIADEILATLSQAYEADVKNIEIETTSVRNEPCPPRNGPTQNLAGLISDAPSMARFAVHACSYKTRE